MRTDMRSSCAIDGRAGVTGRKPLIQGSATEGTKVSGLYPQRVALELVAAAQTRDHTEIDRLTKILCGMGLVRDPKDESAPWRKLPAKVRP